MTSSPTKQFHAFTIKWSNIRKLLVTDIKLVKPDISIKDIKEEQLFKTQALWDTGATNCVIEGKLAKELGLVPIAKADVNHAGGVSEVNVYLISIILPNNVYFEGIRVTECKENIGGFRFIVGMDVITKGDFSVTNTDGKTTFSFRLPSMETIDYVKDYNNIEKLKYKDVGRNDKCPCGSGKKFKDCHWLLLKD